MCSSSARSDYPPVLCPSFVLSFVLPASLLWLLSSCPPCLCYVCLLSFICPPLLSALYHVRPLPGPITFLCFVRALFVRHASSVRPVSVLCPSFVRPAPVHWRALLVLLIYCLSPVCPHAASSMKFMCVLSIWSAPFVLSVLQVLSRRTFSRPPFCALRRESSGRQ